MRILLIGNYSYAQQQSMQRFSDLMQTLLLEAGLEVRLLKPSPIFGNLKPGEVGLGKWLGYIDRYILFPFILLKATRWADVVHICDHGNAMYANMLGDKPNVVTCHDLLAIQSALGEISNQKTGFTGRIFQRWISSGLRNAQHVVCVSEQTRSELQRLLGVPNKHCSVALNCLNYQYHPMGTDDAVQRLKQYGIDQSTQFFVHVGGNQWYKNRLGIVQLFIQLAVLPQYKNAHLILAGKHWPDDLRVLVHESGFADRIHELTNADNEDIRALYSSAEALLFPSLQEGFGWPIAEAQACGCPVVTTNRAPMTEVGGKAAIYIDPSDMRGAANLVADALIDRPKLVAGGLKNVTRFSGDSMANTYIAAYRFVLTGS